MRIALPEIMRPGLTILGLGLVLLLVGGPWTRPEPPRTRAPRVTPVGPSRKPGRAVVLPDGADPREPAPPTSPDVAATDAESTAEDVAAALAAWRTGEVRGDPDGRHRFPRPFRIDAWTSAFLHHPSCTPAVQFGCTAYVGQDCRLATVLESGTAAVRIQALAVLMRVRAPDSVAEQHRALLALRETHPEWSAPLYELEAAFRPDPILAALARTPPVDWNDDALELCWAIRAAGVLRLEAALPRLGELSTVHVLDVSLAAERSIEEMDGPAADRALAACVRGWQYDAFGRAARALRERDAPLLLETLRGMERPERSAYFFALYRAWCDDPDAVPILCEEVRTCSIIDRKLFDEIERLARPEHLPVVLRLPQAVRPDQRERAAAVVDAVRRRLRAGAGSR